MKRSTLFAPAFILALATFSAGVCAAVYGVRVIAVRRGVARANERISAGEIEKGFAQLARIDYWAGQHPAFISQVRCAAIAGHVGLHHDEAAIALAERELANDRTPPRPSNVWQALYDVVAEQLDPIQLKDIGGREPDPKAGYQAMLRALEATGDVQRIARLDQSIAFPIQGIRHPGIATEPAPPPDPTPAPSRPIAAPEVEAVPHVPTPVVVEEPLPGLPSFGDGQFAVAAGASVRVYDENGKHCGDLPGGTLLTVLETRSSSSGNIVVCRRENAPASAPPLLVRSRDLILRQGDLAELPSTVRGLLAAHGQATSELKRARQRVAERNPHAAAYKTATAEYKAFATEVQRLTAARDEAEGMKRTQYADELHAMKNQAPALQKAYESAKQRYEAWKASDLGSIESDPAVVNSQRRVDQSARELAPYFDS